MSTVVSIVSGMGAGMLVGYVMDPYGFGVSIAAAMIASFTVTYSMLHLTE